MSMACSQCFENPPRINPTCGAGTVREFGGLNTYVTGSPNSKLAIILISDIFGYEAPKFRKLADKVAATGFLVVAPDFFYGDPIIKFKHTEVDFDSWIKVHNTDKGFEDAKQVISALKAEGVTAIGAAGLCWGGKVVVKLASCDDNIQAAVLLHPTWITVDDINAVKVPIAILGAENDRFTPPERLKHFGEILSTKSEIHSFTKIYLGVAHGWTVKYMDDDEFVVKSAEEAHEDMINWFTKHIK